MSKSPLDLGKRERQIVESVYRLGETSVADVLRELENPPSYSSVRAMLGQLVEKGVLKQRQEGKRYLYRPAVSKDKARQSVLKNVLATFFEGNPLDAMVALLDLSNEQLGEDDLKRLKGLIEKTRREKQQ